MKLYNDTVLRVLDKIEKQRTIFADPPDNIQLPYNLVPDNLTYEMYRAFIESLIYKVLIKCDIFWLSIYHKNYPMIAGVLENILRTRHPAWKLRTIIWRFTFGQYTDKQIPNGFRPILMMHSPAVRLDYDKIRVVSERMLLGDSRASGLRIPDDVWEIPRVVGNAKERRPWHPTQHPEELIERILQLSGGPVFDCFSGTGTVLRVSKRLGLAASAAELDSEYCRKVKEEDPDIEICV